MARRLKAFVPVHDGDEVHWFGPDDDVPAKYAKQIRDKAWADDEDEQSEPAGPPPKSGPGSSAEAWALYAEEQGVDVPDGAKQGEIIQALADAGKPTE